MSVDEEGMARAIRAVFNDCQDGSVAMSKSVNKFSKILNKVAADMGGSEEHERKALDIFFEKFIRYLQLPLVWKGKSPFVDR